MVIVNGAPRCLRCDKRVYAAEEVIGPDGSWHKSCFKCGKCNRALDNTTMREHKHDIYCRKCYDDVAGSGAPRPTGDDFSESAAAITPVNARKPVQYTPTPEHSASFANAVTPPQLPQRSYGASADVTAAYRSAYTPSTHESLSRSSSISKTPASQQTPTSRQGGYLGNNGSMPGYKQSAEISPSSVFSSGKSKLNLPPPKDICPRCEKPIFHAEKVVGPGGPWHRSCFRCKNCSRTLTSAILTDHEGEAFCNNCYNKLFAPRGYNIGGSTEPLPQHASSQNGSRESIDRNSQPSSPTRRRSGAVPFVDRDSLAFSYLASSPNKREGLPSDQQPFGSAAVAAASAAVAGQTVRPSSARSSSRLTYGRPYSPKKQFGLGGPPPDVCPRCDKVVYAMELANAAGRKYHKRCLRCIECDTSVNSLQMADRNGEIYCKGCYAKNFGPKGIRLSLGPSINDN
ncbi:Cysteine and glycine-rich protein 3 [Coemansia spiralis]|uniref:Cysteine and glycine-rich protein 3 n=2 Tax=Coemansia TaxID=4863 RepID=A0A9W8KUW9_9FUNG|nr:hypothetical protein BX070DRAFT_225607 [Coemansia spiralis]KAJ1992276.1 Cysteine and glycine-rich protein 3 [Coemansia umbellata]KAJ2623390.1 Cysteine and glycine-rich protein 3 [Coemansia sp. RSA 1358]KAJ2672268.1 Cysteine and glycine-rich protein 3 [Coemansia spiralis]